MIALSSVFVLSAGVSIVQAGVPWQEVGKIAASDGSAHAGFGHSMAMSGKFILVGARTEGSNGVDAGAVYLFDAASGMEVLKLTASDGENGDTFGGSVDIDGDLAIVGAPGDSNENGFKSGAAYIFDITTGEELIKLIAEDGQDLDFFGTSVAISGNLAVVGANFADGHVVDSGAVYVFDLTTGAQIFKLFSPTGRKSDNFGEVVVIDGSHLIIGAIGDNDRGKRAGAVYIFDVNTGEQQHKVFASDASAYSVFGDSIAVDGQYAVIGSSGDGDNGMLSGSAYVFDVTTGEQLYKLLPSDGEELEFFGSSVAIDGQFAVIGSEFSTCVGMRTGAAYIYDVTTGEQVNKLLASDCHENDLFGTSLLIKRDVVLAGASGSDPLGADSGAVFVYKRAR